MLDKLLNALTLILWGIFLVLLFYRLIKGFQEGGFKGLLSGLTSGLIVFSLFVVLSVTLLSAALVFIEPQEVAMVISIISRNGYREEPLRSGLHWITPLAEQVVRYPIYWQTYTMSSEPLEGEKVGDDSIAARSSDGQAVYLDISVIYRIDSNEVVRIHIDLQDRYVDDYLRPFLRGVVRTEVSQFTADEINSSKRKNLETILDEKIREAFNDKGFILDRFLLRNIGFSDQYASAVEEKQVAEQQKLMAEFQAEQMRKLAEGTRDKMKIEAEGRAEAYIIEGEAQAEIILVKAQAEADALRLINQILAQNPDLITYRYVEKLGSNVRVMLVPTDNPFLLPLPDLMDEISTTEIIPYDLGLTTTLTTTIPITETVP